MQQRIIIGSIGTTLVLCLILIFWPSKNNLVQSPTPPPLMVDTTTLNPHIPPMAKAYGIVTNHAHANIQTEVPGTIAYIIKDGQPIQHHQTLVQISPETYQRRAHQARLNLDAIDKDIVSAQDRLSYLSEQINKTDKIVAINNALFEKNQSLAQSSLISNQELENSEKNALNAQMELAHLQHDHTQQKHQLTQLLMQQQHAQLEAQEAQSQSDKTQLKAPFSGVITDVMAAEGEQARPGQTLLTLTDPKQNILTVHLPYTYVTRLLQLKNAKAIDESGHTFTMMDLSPNSPNGITVDVTFKPKQPSDWIEGQRLGVWVQLPAIDNAYAIPAAALYDDHIFRIHQQRLEKIPVHVKGRAYDQDAMVIITSDDLNADDTILSSRIYNPEQPDLTVKQRT